MYKHRGVPGDRFVTGSLGPGPIPSQQADWLRVKTLKGLSLGASERASNSYIDDSFYSTPKRQLKCKSEPERERERWAIPKAGEKFLFVSEEWCLVPHEEPLVRAPVLWAALSRNENSFLYDKSPIQCECWGQTRRWFPQLLLQKFLPAFSLAPVARRGAPSKKAGWRRPGAVPFVHASMQQGRPGHSV